MAKRVTFTADRLDVLLRARMDLLFVSREWRRTDPDGWAADIAKLEWIAAKLDEIFELGDVEDKPAVFSRTRRRVTE